MNIFKFRVLYFLMLLSIISSGQKNDYVTVHGDVELQRMTLQILDSIPTCSLITIDSVGAPRVRIMSPFPVDSTFTVWLGSHTKSRKVNQIKNNPKVAVNYFNLRTSEYVSIHGNAVLVNSADKKEKYWKNEWKDYYPNRQHDYILIKITPEWVEVLSPDRGLLSDETTGKPVSFRMD